MPLWLLGLRCLGSAAAATCAAMAISRVLHQAADRSDAGEVLCCWRHRSLHNIDSADVLTYSTLMCPALHARPANSLHAHHRLPAAQDLEWTVSMSSSEEDLDDNVFTQQRSLFKSGLDAFMVALHRWGVNAKRSLVHRCRHQAAKILQHPP